MSKLIKLISTAVTTSPIWIIRRYRELMREKSALREKYPDYDEFVIQLNVWYSILQTQLWVLIIVVMIGSVLDMVGIF